MSAPVWVPVEGPRPLREAGGLLGLWLLVLALVGVSGRLTPSPELPFTQELRAFQRRPRELSFSAQRLYRELLSSVPELVYLSLEDGLWPTPEELEEELLPPFEDPVRYAFTLESIGEDALYLGEPLEPGLPAILLELKPNRGLGSTHGDFDLGSHRLGLPGMVLHFFVWIHPDPKDLSGIPLQPAFEGWKQVVPPPKRGPSLQQAPPRTR